MTLRDGENSVPLPVFPLRGGIGAAATWVGGGNSAHARDPAVADKRLRRSAACASSFNEFADDSQPAVAADDNYCTNRSDVLI